MAQKIGRIRDVARETGLSTATISRVMNGAKNVSPETRKRVLDACSKLDYLPNPAARALSTSKSRTIAAIIPTIEHSIYAKYIAAIEQTLSESGYSLVLAISKGDDDTELQAARKLLGMGAQAFILSGGAHSPDLMALFARRNVPFVFSSIWDLQSEIPTIGYDNADLAYNAVEYLVHKGHREIAVLHGPLAESDRTRARLDGVLRADREDLALSFFETSLDVAGGREAVDRLRERSPNATAVLCFSDVLALGCYFGFMNVGLSVPDDISVMGFDNLDWSASVLPGLTTIDLPAADMGRNVAAQLVSHLESGTPVAPTHLDGVIVERASVADLAAR
ncbi:MAG: LacI family DNA-binding transcriptional regulator [Pseudomonadota bacterium]